MDATRRLMEEHRCIEKTLEAWDNWADGLSTRNEDDARTELAEALGFVRDYADRIHHGKEEEVLFVAMIDAGLSAEDGPIGVMLYEHTQGRDLITGIEEIAKKTGAWTAEDRENIAEGIHEFGDLLRHHIEKEDNILYPMAQERLLPATQDQVSADCRRFDEAKAQDIERLEALSAALVAAYT